MSVSLIGKDGSAIAAEGTSTTATLTGTGITDTAPIAPAGRQPRRGDWPAWLNLPHTPHFAPEPTPPKARRRDTDDDLLMIL